MDGNGSAKFFLGECFIGRIVERRKFLWSEIESIKCEIYGASLGADEQRCGPCPCAKNFLAPADEFLQCPGKVEGQRNRANQEK